MQDSMCYREVFAGLFSEGEESPGERRRKR